MSSRSSPFSFDNIRASMRCQTINIYCLEGLHGVGKTSICNALKEKGYTVVDEGFMAGEDFEKYVSSFGSACRCHTFALEFSWVGKMLGTVCSLCNAHRKGEIVLKDRMIFCDRCYITPVIYGALPGLGECAFTSLMNIVCNAIEGEFNVKFRYIYLARPSLDDVYEKITERAEAEPVRKKLNELDYGFLENIEDMYAARHRWFDLKYDLPSYGFLTSSEEADELLNELKTGMAFDENVNEALGRIGEFLGKHIENGK